MAAHRLTDRERPAEVPLHGIGFSAVGRKRPPDVASFVQSAAPLSVNLLISPPPQMTASPKFEWPQCSVPQGLSLRPSADLGEAAHRFPDWGASADRRGGTVDRESPGLPKFGAAAEEPRLLAPAVTLRLPPFGPVGAGQHRSGWPYAIACLRPLVAADGILFDDFVERTFCYGRSRPGWQEPWVGVFHHPPAMPAFSVINHQLQQLFRRPEFRASLPHLVRAVALSEYLARWLREELAVPVDVIRHPTEMNVPRWSPSAWLAGGRRLVQIGWYLRNTRAVDQVPPTPGLRRCRLPVGRGATRRWDADVARHWRSRGDRREYPGVEELPRLADAGYDQLLASGVVLAELFDASANNLVVECLVRATPIACNRHPAVTEHLGADYPLYFDRIEEVPDLLATHRVVAAHDYLKTLDIRPYTGEAFAAAVQETIHKAQEGAT